MLTRHTLADLIQLPHFMNVNAIYIAYIACDITETIAKIPLAADAAACSAGGVRTLQAVRGCWPRRPCELDKVSLHNAFPSFPQFCPTVYLLDASRHGELRLLLLLLLLMLLLLCCCLILHASMRAVACCCVEPH